MLFCKCPADCDNNLINDVREQIINHPPHHIPVRIHCKDGTLEETSVVHFIVKRRAYEFQTDHTFTALWYDAVRDRTHDLWTDCEHSTGALSRQLTLLRVAQWTVLHDGTRENLV